MANKSLSPLAIPVKDLETALSYLYLLLPNSFSLFNELVEYSSSRSSFLLFTDLQKGFNSHCPPYQICTQLSSFRVFHLQIPLLTNRFL